MDALYPRLLVRDFDTAVEFYRGVLGEPARAIPEASYASWDIDGTTALALYDRAAIAEVAGTTGLSETAAAQDAVMLAMRVEDVDAAVDRLTRRGARVVTAARDRPEWGPTMRAAHVRDPEGNLIELQSYAD
jgi:predicted enzyme related to lactoylglutathione lyase